MRKIFLFLFCVAFFLAGCSQRNQANVVNVWHWMIDRQETFLELAQQYKEQTGIEVKFELYAPSETYSRKIIAAAQARVLPDIYGILGDKKKLASFINSGFVADLTKDFEGNGGAWEKSIFSKALDSNRFEEGNVYSVNSGIYGVPIDVMNIQMLYNKDLLAKAGIKRYPKTFTEFMEDIAALNRIGIEGLISGWGETWMVDCFASNYAFNIMGEEKVMATYKGDVPYTDEDWIKVFTLFKDLRENNALAQGIVTKGNKYAEQDFALGRSAFAFNGSWCVNVYNEMDQNLNYGVMLPPVVNEERPMQIWGGAGSSFVVNDSSKNKQQAINFLKWLTAKEQQAFLSKKTKNLPANRYALSSIPEILSQFASAMDKTTHPSIWKYNEDAMVQETFDRGIQSIIIGEKTPEEVAQAVQAMKVREMEKAQKRMKRQ
ncbi:MAG: extracellular solute-binding protein [Candidatus Omnitrophica bacterium]|nr:extracellular solute-binding protein [Candidatus Omnitrophota bacterium]